MVNGEMYRRKINKSHIYSKTGLIILIVLIFGFGVFGIQAGLIGNFLSEVNSKLTDEDYVHTIGGKSIITDIYYKSLEIAKTNEVFSLNNAIKLSVDYMKNKDIKCNLNKTDMLNILYNSNDSFKRSFKQNITNTYKSKPQYPTNEDYLKSCYVFMGCFYGIYDYEDSPYIRKTCATKANDIYSQMYINGDSIASFDQINFGDDMFRNGKLDDADYDLLYDIDVIGKILFESSKTPPQVLYYQFPDINSAGGNDNLEIPYDGTIDWFSPYDPSDFPDTNSGNNNGNNTGSTGGSNVNEGNNGTLNNNTLIEPENGSLDEEIKKFLDTNTSNTYLQNQDDSSNVLNGNICITGSNTQELSNTGSIYSGDIIKQYLSGLIKEITENKNEGTNSITTGGTSFVSGNIVNLTGTKQEIIDQIDDQVEMLSNIDDEVSQQAIQGCIDKCDGLPISDKAVCIVKCTCTEFSSPAYNDILKAGTFKIKFCMIPVQNKGFSKNGKTVYSIEEIYNEVSAILLSLRDSGELLVSKKTKEFLESSTTKNKFGKILSFSISSSFKSLFSNSDSKTDKRDEEIFVKDAQKSILCYGDGLDSASEKNKYIMSNPLDEVANNEIIKSSSFGLSNGCVSSVDPIKLLQEDRLIQSNTIVFEFLKTHLAFWQDVVVMMKDINQTAKALSKKKK
ncbi:MAG: hypothetical protein WAZ75_03810 [Candidatus Absconditicoccaceae bacterium]